MFSLVKFVCVNQLNKGSSTECSVVQADLLVEVIEKITCLIMGSYAYQLYRFDKCNLHVMDLMIGIEEHLYEALRSFNASLWR